MENQLEKIFKHTRAGSYGTRARYEHSCRNFVRYLGKHFKMKNLRNLQDKHQVSYIQYRQSQGMAAKTIKNDLVAIRYMHDLVSRAKHELSDNEGLKKKYAVVLEKTPAIKGDRAWTQEEYNQMQQLATEMAQKGGAGAATAKDAQDVMQLARTMGLRVTEAVAMKRSQAEQALRTGVYQVRGEAKNGKWREVPLSKAGKDLLQQRLRKTSRGQRLFIRPQEQTHEAVNRVEKFNSHHRHKVETTEGMIQRTWTKDGSTHVNELTIHGLRYGYVQDRVQEERDKGFSLEQAAARVTREVGHERIDVIRVYLGKGENEDEE
nr:phage integrase N-terminal domain-containing protein [Bacillus piscicola]